MNEIKRSSDRINAAIEKAKAAERTGTRIDRAIEKALASENAKGRLDRAIEKARVAENSNQGGIAPTKPQTPVIATVPTTHISSGGSMPNTTTNSLGHGGLGAPNEKSVTQSTSTKPLTGFAAGVQANNEGYRKLAEKPSFGNYVGRRFVGGAAEATEGTANAVGYWQQNIAKSAELRRENALRSVAATTKNGDTKKAIESLLKDTNAQDTAYRPTEAYFNFGDKYTEKTQEKFADADFGKAGELIADVAEGTGGMIARIPANFVPGLGSLITFASAYGNAKQSAQKNGADEASASLYALGSAAVELGTEKMLGFTDFAGKGALDDIAKEYITNLAKSEAGKVALNTILGALGEGAEEFIAEYGQAYIDKLTTQIDKRSLKELSKDAWYNALVGGITAVLFDTADIIRGGNGKLPTAEDLEAITTQAAEETVSSIAVEAGVLGGNTESKSKDGNTRLTENDITEYIATGERQHVRNGKEALLRMGESPILTTPASIVGFIKDALTGKRRNVIKAYGRVGQRFSADVYAKSEGTTNIAGYYIELDANKLAHMKDHLESDEDLRNIPLTEEQLTHLPDYIDNYDDVIDVVRRKDGSVRIMLGKKINGHTIIVETVSKGRKSVHPVTAYQIPTEWYKSYYKPKAATANTSQTASAVESGYKAITASIHNIPQAKNEVNGKTAKGQFPLLYTERLSEYAKRDGNIYSQRLLQRETEKAQRNLRKANSKGNGSRPTIYADRIKMQEGNLQDGGMQIEKLQFGDIIRTRTQNGVEVENITAHMLERGRERYVTAEDIIEALMEPLHIREVVVDEMGRKSQRFIGENATVNINPDTGAVVTAWKTGAKTRNRYLKEKN